MPLCLTSTKKNTLFFGFLFLSFKFLIKKMAQGCTVLLAVKFTIFIY